MSGSWKRLDLGGGGLQQANLQLARALRKRCTAYVLWIAFPVGAHRWYLREPIGAIVYCVLALATAAAWQAVLPALAFALFDLWWIDRRVTRLNKRLRMEAYLHPGAGGPPPGYTRRFGKD